MSNARRWAKYTVNLGALFAAALIFAACQAEEPEAAGEPEAIGEPEAEPGDDEVPGLVRTESPVPMGEMNWQGPDGEVPEWYTEVNLTEEQLAEIREGGYSGAFLNHLESPFMQALIDGAADAFEQMGIEMAAVTNAEFDPAQQAADVETVLALDIDIILSAAIDPVAAAAGFRPAVERGVKIVFLSNKAEGYKKTEDFVNIVTYDVEGLGTETADSIAEGLGGEGRIAFIFHDADYWITDMREQAVRDELASNYPEIEIVIEEPLADAGTGEEITEAILIREPDIDAIFVPWDTPAEGVVAALRAANRDDIKVYTIDLGASNALDMATDGTVQCMTSTLAHEFGFTAAVSGALGILGEEVPDMAIVPAFAVCKDNLETGWELTFNRGLPDEVLQELD